ncbi:MAG TPA: type IV-A pilus assembly ATPase PilB [Candidatus Saccharicenans sp.]|nr:type IV-A pilus assembly ATPase PilB [Candidatus Saccharicenans sp.]HOL46082.1 type IV-A pilus assembly ATPase PilB [Candidatus Saccharicenans sp.]HPP24017.1 type IV-A pilus assembly ATPase PilB [Candidatus Saccharicenans sp.]
MASKLGELLLREKIIDSEKLRQAIDYQKKNNLPISSALVALGFLTEEEIAQALSRQLGYPYIDLDQFEVFPEVISLIPAETAKRNLVMPIHKIKSFLTLAMVDPTDLEVIEDIRFRTGLSVQPVISTETGVTNAINKYYGTSDALKVKKLIEDIELADESRVNVIDEKEIAEGSDYDVAEMEQASNEAPIITLVNQTFIDAIKKGASDVHFEPYEQQFRIRYRIDGDLYEVADLPLKFRSPVLSRVKILANMDIAEKRLPQDGRIKLRVKLDNGKRKEVDMRVSSLPTMFGEKIVARILDKEMLKLDLTQLGFEPESLEIFQDAIHRPWGIILVTGPTGSGKTNTLYSAISTLNTIDVNIMTAEDPVEFYIPGINQVQIKEEIGLTFANALRSFLRQDPDIMLVGEIRDYETIDMAIKAALTGHLVFSTIHTNDAPSTIARMINMNVEPFLIADSVVLIVAQRLVRRLCQKCCEPHELPKRALLDMGFGENEIDDLHIFKAHGCEACNNTGYKGRTALFEVMKITDEIKEMILNRATSREIKRKAIENGMLTLRRSGLVKIKNGVTSVEEVLRETVRDWE